MCGVIGLIKTLADAEFPLELLKRMAHEAQIRGQHSTGAAWFRDSFLDHNSLSVPAQFFPFDEIGGTTSAAIVHTRYSTSDLSHNQPMLNIDDHVVTSALIHNGVVTQASPDQWEQEFGVKCGGRNDSEILAQLYNQNRHPLQLQNSSQACIVLDNRDGSVRWWRNEQRPLYYTNHFDYIAIASTKDILVRSGAAQQDYYISTCRPCVEYSVRLRHGDAIIRNAMIRKPNLDLQSEKL